MNESQDSTEKILAASNQNNVTLIAEGLTKQHFIELNPSMSIRGSLYSNQLLNDEWSTNIKNSNPENIESDKNESLDLFETEVSERLIQEARKRLESTLSSQKISAFTESDRSGKTSPVDLKTQNYLLQNPAQIKDNLIDRANTYYNESLVYFDEGNYEKTIMTLNKAFSLNSFNIQFYLLKCESFINLCDFKSAILTINKLLSVLSMWTDKDDTSYDQLKANLLDKIVFCHFARAQIFYDSKYYIDALESFNKASELKPNNLNYKIRSVSCLFAIGRLNESLSLLNKVIDENETNTNNPNLNVLRARINLKNMNMTECYYDLRRALDIEPNHKEANSLFSYIEETAENLRNTALILSLNNRLSDALGKMNAAITLNPIKAEYNLQRGILYRRLKDFNSAIDDYLLGLEKMNHDKSKEPILYANFHRHILLTYNDFAIVCYQKEFYDDAIVLLNKAIKIEKNEKGFYVNRGDCFYKKKEIQFALLDYEQAFEMDPNDDEIKNRISKINYELAIEKYNQKIYQDATNHFAIAIKYSPKIAKYYISRARTYFFTNEKTLAQIDICISILLDPVNKEIPTIISRIFPDLNLDDVLSSNQMKEAKRYLEKLKIPNVFDISNELKNESDSSRKQIVKKYNNIIPDIKSVEKEKYENLKFIEEKNKIKSVLKEAKIINLNTSIPKLNLNPTIQIERDPKKINWRKFNSGIGSIK